MVVQQLMESQLYWSCEWIHHGGSTMVVFIPTAVGGDEFVRSTQKQRESSRLAATSKNPRNLFGLESNELAQKSDPIRACTATVLTLVDILVSTKMSMEQGHLLLDRGSMLV